MLETLSTFDTQLVIWITAHQAAWLDPVMLALTWAGRRGAIWIALAGLIAWRQPRRLGGLWQLLLALVFVWIVVDLAAKPATNRARPFVQNPLVTVVGDRPASHSFPSGHAATAFAGALIVGRMWRRGRPALIGLAALTALSRVYLGVHYVSDIAAGALIGVAVASLATSTTWWDEPTE